MPTPKILALSGSARKGSWNQKLVEIAAAGASDAGAEVHVLDIGEYELPVFNEDIENEGTPENATKLKTLFVEHDGLLIASPEYNSSISPLLKNVIDWVSRPAEGEPPLVAYTNKVASLMSASPGGLGGLRGLVHVRAILGNIGVTVLPKQVAVSKAFEAFDERGSLKDDKLREEVRSLGKILAETIEKLSRK